MVLLTVAASKHKHPLIHSHLRVISWLADFRCPQFRAPLMFLQKMFSRTLFPSDCVWSLGFGDLHPVPSFDLALLFLSLINGVTLSVCFINCIILS